MSLADTAVAGLDYTEVLFGIIIAWVLVAVWQRVVENLAYNTFRLNPESAFHAFVVAIVMTIIFLTLISSVNSVSRDILVGDTATSTTTVSTPAPPVIETVNKKEIFSEEQKYGIYLRSGKFRRSNRDSRIVSRRSLSVDTEGYYPVSI